MVYECFDKETSYSGIKKENIPNKELVKELHKPLLRKFHKRKGQSPSIENIWGADLADMKLISKLNTKTCGLFLYKIKKVLHLLM